MLPIAKLGKVKEIEEGGIRDSATHAFHIDLLKVIVLTNRR